MTKVKLKLVKTKPENKNQPSALHILPKKPASLPVLTLAERTEAARFKALTTAKAARQARLRQMLVRLQDPGGASSPVGDGDVGDPGGVSYSVRDLDAA